MQENTETKPNGFSLVEVLIAIAILAFAAMALVQLMALGVKMNVQTVDDTQATTLAQWKMEQLTGIGYSYLNPGGDLNTSNAPDYSDQFQAPGSAVKYTRNWKITPCGHDVTTNPCTVAEEYFQTPWYEVSVRVYTDRINPVAGTQPRQITLKAIILQPF